MRRFQIGLLACLLPAFVLSLALTGCGGGDKDKTTTTSSTTDKGSGDKKDGGGKDGKVAGKGTEPILAGTGTVKGKVTVKKTPELDKILGGNYLENMKTAKIPETDQKVCTAGDMSEQTWKVNNDGGVKNVFVWLAPPRGKFFAVDASKVEPKDVVIDQPHCAFEPHCAWVVPEFKDKDGKTQKGQKLIIKNSAPMGHNTKWGDASQSQGGNQTIEPKKDLIPEIKPDKEVIALNCSIHPWMNGFVWSVDHPYIAITKDDGTYEIKNVPTGTKLSIVPWHEAAEYIAGKAGQEIEVKDGETVTKDFEIPADKVKK